mmetsp:Transcript_28363/g.74480  ORF Transcript_28363/g.74480 Transcript_28363/m.74480 type:complete len:255 (+) Transcript_28363:78-842(+)
MGCCNSTGGGGTDGTEYFRAEPVDEAAVGKAVAAARADSLQGRTRSYTEAIGDTTAPSSPGGVAQVFAEANETERRGLVARFGDGPLAVKPMRFVRRTTSEFDGHNAAYSTLTTAYPSTVAMFASPFRITPTGADAAIPTTPGEMRALRESPGRSAFSSVSRPTPRGPGRGSQGESAYVTLSTAHPSTISMFATPLPLGSRPSTAAATPAVDEFRGQAVGATVGLEAYASLTTMHPSTIGMFAGPLCAPVSLSA